MATTAKKVEAAKRVPDPDEIPTPEQVIEYLKTGKVHD
jgi:hypothetical protein